MIDFEPFGPWEHVIRTLSTDLPREVMSSAQWGERKAGEKLVAIVKRHISLQDLDWPSKVKTGSNSSLIYVSSGLYRKSIKTWQKAGIRYVGIKDNVMDERGTPLYKIAMWMELGTVRMPARPLWEPSIRELGGAKGVSKIIQQVITNKLRKLGHI